VLREKSLTDPAKFGFALVPAYILRTDAIVRKGVCMQLSFKHMLQLGLCKTVQERTLDISVLFILKVQRKVGKMSVRVGLRAMNRCQNISQIVTMWEVG